MYLSSQPRKRVTVRTLAQMKQAGEPIAMLTAYDYTMAHLLDAAGVDILLVGDSAANIMAGYETTLPISLDEMIYHAASVVRARQHALVVVDMPFGSYQTSPQEAVHSAVRIMKESRADAVKLEGGAPVFEAIRCILAAGIPVIGHLGLTPQAVHQLGGYGLQAKEEAEAGQLLREAEQLARLGCSALVLEKVPAALAQRVTAAIPIPTIGIGAGNGTDGQVLVTQDMLGMNEQFHPKFLRCFAQVGAVIQEAAGRYIEEVRTRSFPSADESY